MSTGKWAQRLRDFQNTPKSSTPKTPESRVLGVLGVGSKGCTEKCNVQMCDHCRHMSRARTCLEPIAAGLAEAALPRWCDLMNGHGRTCPAFSQATKGRP